MQINLIPDSSVSSAPAGFTAAIQAAADVFEQDFSGNYTVNIRYGWGTINNQANQTLTDLDGTFALGLEVGYTDNVSYATVKSWLTANATLPDQIAAVSSLPVSNTAFPGDANAFNVSSAEEKAFGKFTGSASATDGAIGFNTAYANDSAFWKTAAFTEISHALGWSTDFYAGQPTIADLFRYSSPGNYEWTGGQPAYFSIDGGTTDLANFSTSFDYTLFTNLASNDPLNLIVSTPAQTLTSLDVELLNVIGFGKSPTIIYGNQDHLSVNADNSIGDTIIVGNGDYDFVSANYSSYCTIIVGNGINDLVTAGNSSFDTIILGNGAGDTVNAFDALHDTIILGNGAGDTVDTNTTSFGSSYDTIILGNGERDIVYADGTNHDTITLGNGAGDSVDADNTGFGLVSSYDTITLGNGAGDVVDAYSTNHDTITLGNGINDFVSADFSNFDTITLGNGAGDTVNAIGSSNDTITIGNGAADTVNADTTSSGLFSSYDTITLGNGAHDLVVNPDGSSHDTITLGNGTGDGVSVNGSSSDTITLGNGAGDGVSFGGFFPSLGENVGNTVTLGNGAGDSFSGGFKSFVNTITLGNGAGDVVTEFGPFGEGGGNNDTITVGDGAGDVVRGIFSTATITVGNGAGDSVNVTSNGFFFASPTITVGDGNNDTVNISDSIRSADKVTLGNGDNDTVNATSTLGATITVGNGNDTIYVGSNNTVAVGTGQDSFVFQQTTPGNIGAVTVTGFDPGKDSFTFSTQLTSSVSYHDNAQGNAVVTVDNAGDTITLVGVHASELHPSDFHFVDPAAAPAIATTAQMVADLHAHNIL